MVIVQGSQEPSDQIRPIQFLAVGNHSQVPAPLIRITTCGLLSIEVVEEIVSTDPPLARYVPLTPEQLRGRGTAPALTLLKLLLSRPERFALKEWLTEQFCRDRELFSNVRLDNIVSLLRGVLCPPAYEALRTHLVAYVRSSPGGGDGYQLAAFPLIWVDSEALAWYVEQAARLERFSDEALPYWERAYALAKRGTYFPDEVYTDWSAPKRDDVAGLLRQSVQALARLYLARHSAVGEEEALLLLRSYWQEHPREEDVLRPLMELLRRRECFQEALGYYTMLEKMLVEEGNEPDEHTKDLAAFLRTKHITRSPNNGAQMSPHQHIQDTTPTVLFSTASSCPPLSSDMPVPMAQQHILDASPMAFAQMLPVELSSEDIAIWFGVRVAHIFCLIQQWNKHASFCDTLQVTIDREIAMFENPQGTSSAEVFTLSRRQALISLAALPTMLTALMQGQSFAVIPEEFLPQCAASITACWHLLRGQEFLLVEKILTRYLPTLADMSHQPFAHQSVAASLATQGYRLMGILALHRNNPHARTAYREQAVHLAEITKTPNLLAAALLSLGDNTNDPAKASVLYQRGMSFKQDLSPLLLSRLYARLAVVSAQQGEEHDALRSLDLAKKHYPDHPEADPGFLYAEFSPASLVMEEGSTYLALAQQEKNGYAQQAWTTFAQVEQWQSSVPIPARIQFEIVNYQAGTTLALDDLEAFCERLEQGVHGARLLQSDQRRREALLLYKNACIVWPDEARIRSLADLFL